jgi:hypothetical protein
MTKFTSIRRWAKLILAASALAASAAVAFPAAPASSAVPLCFGQPVTKVATPGVPTVGTGGDDVILGAHGDATSPVEFIFGMGGNDRICSLGGRDTVFGGVGHDRIAGGEHSDVLNGEAGNDVIGCGFDTNNQDVDIADGGTGTDSLNFGAAQADCEDVRNIP